MPAKTTKSTKAKSNVARATGKAGLLNKKVKFNWKIAAVIGVVLIAAVGYLFVRLSKAAAYTWTAGMIKTNGNPVVYYNNQFLIKSIETLTGTTRTQSMQAWVNSTVKQDDVYCVAGATTGDLPPKSASMNVLYLNANGYNVKQEQDIYYTIPKGIFKRCIYVKYDPSMAGNTRRISFYANYPNQGQILYVGAMYRQGSTTLEPGVKN